MAPGWSWSASGGSPERWSALGGGAAFPTQADAEAWLAETWPQLQGLGVAAVTLLTDDRVVYGPMPLRAG